MLVCEHEMEHPIGMVEAARSIGCFAEKLKPHFVYSVRVEHVAINNLLRRGSSMQRILRFLLCFFFSFTHAICGSFLFPPLLFSLSLFFFFIVSRRSDVAINSNTSHCFLRYLRPRRSLSSRLSVRWLLTTQRGYPR